MKTTLNAILTHSAKLTGKSLKAFAAQVRVAATRRPAKAIHQARCEEIRVASGELGAGPKVYRVTFADKKIEDVWVYSGQTLEGVLDGALVVKVQELAGV